MKIAPEFIRGTQYRFCLSVRFSVLSMKRAGKAGWGIQYKGTEIAVGLFKATTGGCGKKSAKADYR